MRLRTRRTKDRRTLRCPVRRRGAPGDSPEYEYAWTASGDTPDTALLSRADVASPTFYVPDEMDEDKTYEYLLTVSAANADDAAAEVSVTVLNRKPLIVFCAVPASVYEGSEGVLFDCSASGAPGDSPEYAYSWTASGDTPDTALLSATDVASPTFAVPDDVGEDKTYEYSLTVSAENADTHSLDVTLKVLRKGALSIACTIPLSVYEGSGDVLFDCSASGAPGDSPEYAYSWTARGDTPDTALLSRADVASPTFSVPAGVAATTRYEYLLTVSAANAENAGLDVAITVLNIRALSLACTDPEAIYEGAPDIALACSASGAPGDNPQYAYVWTAQGDTQDTALLSATDVASPTFAVPDDVAATTTYEYRLTVSSENAEAGSAGVRVTVLNRGALAVVCADPGSVYEDSPDIALACSASGAPGDSPEYAYSWTASGDTQDTALTVTLRLEVVAPVRVTVNVAAVPSDTGEAPALMLTSGVVVPSLSLTVTVAEDDVPRS